MAENIGTVTGTRKQSVACVEIFTRASTSPADWSIMFHFEDGVYDSSGKLSGPTQSGSRRVSRSFGDIKGDVIASGVTVSQIADLIRAAAYKYRQQDVDAAAAVEVAAAEAAAAKKKADSPKSQ